MTFTLISVAALAGCGAEPDPAEEEAESQPLAAGACKAEGCPPPNPWQPGVPGPQPPSTPPGPVDCSVEASCAGGGKISCSVSKGVRRSCSVGTTDIDVATETKLPRPKRWVRCQAFDKNGRLVESEGGECHL